MSNNTIYQITLTPVGRFFFGGEVVFGGGESAQDQRRRSYLVHSNLLPQQTTILGMLREELLRQNGLLKPWNDDQVPDKQGDLKTKEQKKDLALALVGSTGFSVHTGRLPNAQAMPSFGVIEKISPLVLWEDKTKTSFLPAPLDDDQVTDQNDASLKKALTWKSKNAADDSILLENYDPKAGLSLRFAPENRDSSPRALEDFFQQQEQVGITVSNRHNWRSTIGDDEGFFRHSSYRNRNSAFAASFENATPAEATGFRFWVKVGVAPDGLAFWNDGLVQMGGERSTFRMSVKVLTDAHIEDGLFEVPYRYNIRPPAGYVRMLLLSDTFLPIETVEKNGVFPLAVTRPFRFFSTNLERTKSFYDFKQETLLEETPDGKKAFNFQKKYQSTSQGRSQSRRFTLLERGGVLLVPQANESNIRSAIESHTDFRQIGYNYYQTLKSS